MPEKTLNLPLSGAEITEAVIDVIRRRLRSQCFLSPNTAYDRYSGHITIDLRCHDIGRIDEVSTDIPISGGPNVNEPHLEDEDRFLKDEIDIPSSDSPNDVRVDTGQPVPTLAKGEGGKQEIKGVRYGRQPERPGQGGTPGVNAGVPEGGVQSTTSPEVR
jgi:hypothetical protein